MSDDYEVVQRPSKPLRSLQRSIATSEYPIETICASADTGTAIRLHIPFSREPAMNHPRTPFTTPSTRKNNLPVKQSTNGSSSKPGGTTVRSRALNKIRDALVTRGFTLEWSRDPTSEDHILVWAVRREEG